MASAVAELLPQYKDKLRVTGRVRRYNYNGRFIDDFEVQNIYAVKIAEKFGLALKMEPVAASKRNHDMRNDNRFNSTDVEEGIRHDESNGKY